MKREGATKEATNHHSPLPWQWLPDEGQFIVDAKGNIVAEIPCQGCNPIDGEFLVTAVNERERLRELVQDFRKWLIMPGSDGVEHTAWPEWIARIDAALNGEKGEGG